MVKYPCVLKDALRVIELEPESVKGHLRKAEVLQAAQQYNEAKECYMKCFQLSARDKEDFMEMAKRCKREQAKESSLDEQFPFVSAASGDDNKINSFY